MRCSFERRFFEIIFDDNPDRRAAVPRLSGNIASASFVVV